MMAPLSALPLGTQRLLTDEFETVPATDSEVVSGERYAVSLHATMFEPVLGVVISRGGRMFDVVHLLQPTAFWTQETTELRATVPVYLLNISGRPEYWPGEIRV